MALKSLQAHFIENGLARTTINSRVAIVRRIFRWAVGEQLCPPSVIHGLSAVMGLQAGRTTARETAPVGPVPDNVVEQTTPYMPTVVADMVQIQRLCGCRPAEIAIMRPLDIDASAEVWLYRPATHKTEHFGRERVIPIGPRAQAILQPYLLREAEAYCFRPCDSERERLAAQRASRKTRVQPSQAKRRKPRPQRSPGDCYSVAAYRRAIARACNSAFPAPPGLSVDEQLTWRQAHRWHPNRLRHAAATEIRKQFGVEAARIQLGHSKVSTTEIYAARDLESAALVAKLIG